MCCGAQVLAYEVIFLAVAVPWLRDLFTGGYRFRGWLAVVLMVVQMARRKQMEMIGLAESYHSLGVALFAILVLTGPTRPAPRLLPEKANG